MRFLMNHVKGWDRRVVVAVLCVLLAVGLRLPSIGNPPTDIHHVAQAESASVARNMARFGMDLWAPRVDWRGAHPSTEEGGFPLYQALCSVGWSGGSSLGERHYVWARALSVLGWLLGGIALAVWVRRRLPGPVLAYLLLYLFSPLMVVFSRNIQPDVLALGLLLFGLDRMDLARESGPMSVGWLALGGGAAGLAASMDGSLLPLLALPLLSGGRPCLRQGVAALLAASLAVLWFVHAGRLGDGSILAAMVGGGGSPWGGPTQWFSPAVVSGLGGTAVISVLSPLGVLLLGVGGYRGMKTPALRPFLWGGGLVLLSTLVFTPVYALRSFELLPLVPFASVLVGGGAVALLSSTTGRTRVVTLALVLLLTVPSMWLGGEYVAKATERDQRVELLGHIVSALVLAGSPVVVSDQHPQSLLYAMDRRGWGRADLSLAEVGRLEQAGARFLLITDRSPVWTNRPFRSQLIETRPVVARSDVFLLVGLRGPGGVPGVSGVPGVKQ